MRHDFITPVCCEEVQRLHTIFLAMPESYHEDGSGKKSLLDHKPVWRVAHFPRNEHNAHAWTAEAKFCPHCGTSVPDVEPSGDPRKICEYSDGGYYCDTCQERLMSCRCMPSVYAWKVKGKPLNFKRGNIPRGAHLKCIRNTSDSGTKISELTVGKVYLAEDMSCFDKNGEETVFLHEYNEGSFGEWWPASWFEITDEPVSDMD